VAIVVKAIEAEAVEEVKVEVAIKTRANIKVEDVAVEVKKEVTIALVIGYYH
jgi:hypothetical protein